jgi:hypothetical protein
MSTPALPIIYRGWEIWKWTGWKGQKVKIEAGFDGDPCHTCNREIHTGDFVFRNFAAGDSHWTCVYPDNRPERLVAQWLAAKDRRAPNERHAAVMVGALAKFDCEYQRGQMFDIGEEMLVTELTPESEREQHFEEGLFRMYALIDRLEAQ